MGKQPSAEERRQLAKLLEELRQSRSQPAAADREVIYQADLAKAVQVLKEAGLGHLLAPRRPAGVKNAAAPDKIRSRRAGRQDPFIPQLKHGDIISNHQLQTIFRCGSQGGMRRSLRTNSLVLISDHTRGCYYDRWQDGCFHYTGMGLKGDQDLNFAQNRTLAESRHNGVAVFLFEVFTKGQYTFIGRVALAGEPYQEIQPDQGGQNRKVWIFPLKILN